ncbi:MAG: glycosyltransferase family 2 protein [Thermoplasmataceae archaeon]
MEAIGMRANAIVFSYGSKEDVEYYSSLAERIPIERMVLVVGGDFSDEYISSLSRKSANLKIIFERERKGKYYSLISGLESLSGFPLFLISGDVRVDDDIFSKLVEGISSEKEVVMVKVLPQNRDHLSEKVGEVIWVVHDFANEFRFRHGMFFSCGEFQVISHPFQKMIPPVINEDEYLCESLSSNGFKLVYRRDISVRNRVPVSFRGLLTQRIRINIGHLQVAGLRGRTSSLSLNSVKEIGTVCNVLLRITIEKPLMLLFLPLAISLEFLSMVLAVIKYKSGKINLAWTIVNTGSQSN